MTSLSKKKSILKEKFKSTFKNAVSKANPFDKKINRNDVSDTGTEAVKLAYRSVKKGKNSIKAVKRTVRTTKRTIKTVGSAIKGTGTAIYRTTAFTVKSVVTVSKIVGNVAVNTVAFLINPIVIVIIMFVISFVFIFGSILIVISGDDTDKSARVNAGGLVDVSSQYQTGLGYLNTALENKQNEFNSLIDSLYFDYDNLTYSDLVYLERTKPAPSTIYQTSFATDERKNSLKSEWSISLTEHELMAIAYVYLETVENTNNGTKYGIYKVAFNQEVFDTIVSKCVAYSDSVYGNQKCPDENCTEHIEMLPNPDYVSLQKQCDTLADAYNDWGEVASALYDNSQFTNSNAQSAHWNSVVQPVLNTWIVKYNRYPVLDNNGYDFLDTLGSEYETAKEQLNNTPPEIEQVTYICEYQHNLHSIGLAFFDKETVMNALNFDDTTKQWVELTEKGFENNPDIQ